MQARAFTSFGGDALYGGYVLYYVPTAVDGSGATASRTGAVTSPASTAHRARPRRNAALDRKSWTEWIIRNIFLPPGSFEPVGPAPDKSRLQTPCQGSKRD